MPVRGGVLDAPRSCDRRAALDAFVWRGRPHPRHPRCARHRPQPNVCNPAGAARAPFHTGEPKLSANRGRAGVEARPYGVVVADGRRAQPHPRYPRCARLASTTHVSNTAGTARAPFLRAHPRHSFTHAGRAWKPSPTVVGRCPEFTHVAATPQSRPFAPRQLPFQGSRGVGCDTVTSSDRASKRAKRTGPRTGPFCTLKCPRAFQTDSISLV